MWKQVCVGLLASVVASAACAQFAGDVYFAQPSVAIPEGGAADMEVMTFSGSEPVGAVHVELLYDSAELEIVEVEAGSATEFQDGFVYDAVEPGRTAFVGLNSASLTDPFGTVSLARIEVRPIAAAGSRVPLTLSVRQFLGTDSQALPAQGFDGEVVVTSPLSGATSAAVAASPLRATAALRPPTEPSLDRRASSMARPGQTVEIMRLEQSPQGVGATGVPVTVPVQPSIEGGR